MYENMNKINQYSHGKPWLTGPITWLTFDVYLLMLTSNKLWLTMLTTLRQSAHVNVIVYNHMYIILCDCRMHISL